MIEREQYVCTSASGAVGVLRCPTWWESFYWRASLWMHQWDRRFMARYDDLREASGRCCGATMPRGNSRSYCLRCGYVTALPGQKVGYFERRDHAPVGR